MPKPWILLAREGLIGGSNYSCFVIIDEFFLSAILDKYMKILSHLSLCYEEDWFLIRYRSSDKALLSNMAVQDNIMAEEQVDLQILDQCLFYIN